MGDSAFRLRPAGSIWPQPALERVVFRLPLLFVCRAERCYAQREFEAEGMDAFRPVVVLRLINRA